jgi:hypothetical protein
VCSTCDYTRYVKHEVENRGRTQSVLKNEHDESNMYCDVDGKNYKIGNFTIYRCPTCGRQLF